MTNKIGTLASSTTVSAGTTTLYTCPTGKGARGRLFYRGVSGVNSTLSFVVNGIVLFVTGALTTGHVHYSSTALLYNTQTAASGLDGSTEAKTAQPYSRDYWLAAGETVQYIIGTADFTSIKAAFVGTEVDVE